MRTITEKEIKEKNIIKIIKKSKSIKKDCCFPGYAFTVIEKQNKQKTKIILSCSLSVFFKKNHSIFF